MLIVRRDKLNLLEPNNPLLHKRPEPYSFEEDGDPQNLINVLFARMRELGGVGLSANQVGIDRRMFVMGAEIPIAVFNPEIIELNQATESLREGCLTYPGLVLNITRPKAIKVRYQNRHGEIVEEQLIGLSARVFQHEYEHMEGKDFTENVSKLKLDLAKKRFHNLKKKIVKKHAVKTMVEALNESTKSQ